MKLKIVTIVGTRPEIIRLSLIIKKLDIFFDHILVNTMQNSDNELNANFFNELSIRKPDYILNISNRNTGHAIGEVISKSYDLLSKINPDCILILGDTNSGLSAISAKRLRIPIFHMEAGNRSFDLNLPEEINRRIIDEISDINLPYTERSRMNLIHEGKEPRWIFKTGSPLCEVFIEFSKQINKSDILNKQKLLSNDYFLVSLHRSENTSDHKKLLKLFQNISKLGIHFNKKIIVSLHPRTKKTLDDNKILIPDNFIISKPFSFFDYNKLQKESFCVISDSGSLAEESHILKFKAISLRNSTERQESLEFSNFTIGNLDYDSLLCAINLKNNNSIQNCENSTDYDIKNVSDKIINIIQSYTLLVKNREN